MKVTIISKVLHIAKHFCRTHAYRKTLIEWVVYKYFKLPEPELRLCLTDGPLIKVKHWQNLSELHYWRSLGVSEDEKKAVLNAIRQGDGTCIDVGANIGLYSLFFAAAGASRVYAIEASRPNFTRLIKNLSDNSELSKLITPLNVAASDTDESISIQFNPNSPGQTCIVQENEHSDSCETIVIDSFCELNAVSSVALLKIDVEGFEMKVLGGCRRLLQEKRIAFILFESIEQALNNYGSSRRSQWEFLNSFGYQISNLNGSCLSQKDFIESEGTDYLASPILSSTL